VQIAHSSFGYLFNFENGAVTVDLMLDATRLDVIGEVDRSKKATLTQVPSLPSTTAARLRFQMCDNSRPYRLGCRKINGVQRTAYPYVQATLSLLRFKLFTSDVDDAEDL